MKDYMPLQFLADGTLKVLDQRFLPREKQHIICASAEDVHKAISDMAVRGAPCIGYAGLFGLAIAIKSCKHLDWDFIESQANYLKSARPTAVNLAFELDSLLSVMPKTNDKNQLSKYASDYAAMRMTESQNKHLKMIDFTLSHLINKLGKKKFRVMTHCNTGFLACATIGTALGAIEVLAQRDMLEMVYVDETRPYMQGTRLTAFELESLGIPYRIVTEGSASYLMANKLVDAIFVGADRIALNGDTANKIGTSTLSIVAKHYDVPFYVLAPVSSFDFGARSGEDIPIELRDSLEVFNLGNGLMAPEKAQAINPSFDITTSNFITGIACEYGIYEAPYELSLQTLLDGITKEKKI